MTGGHQAWRSTIPGQGGGKSHEEPPKDPLHTRRSEDSAATPASPPGTPLGIGQGKAPPEPRRRAIAGGTGALAERGEQGDHRPRLPAIL